MATFNPNWDTNWTNTSINGSSITNSSTATTATVDNDNKSSTEVSVKIVYGGTANEGAKVYLLRDTDGTTFEGTTDLPWGFQMPYAVSGTRYRTFTVAGSMISKFKVLVSNASGATVTATVKYKQATIDSV
jgi:hypothetical protein